VVLVAVDHFGGDGEDVGGSRPGAQHSTPAWRRARWAACGKGVSSGDLLNPLREG